MKNLLSNIYGYFTNHARLIFGYVLIGGMVAALGLATSLWFRATQLEARNDQLRERVTVVETVNQTQDQTIGTLRDLRIQDGIVIDGLVNDFSKFSTVDKTARKKITQLEKQNVKVRSYLDEPLPDELVCLFDSTLCKAGDQNPSGTGENPAPKSATGPVPSAGSSTAAAKP